MGTTITSETDRKLDEARRDAKKIRQRLKNKPRTLITRAERQNAAPFYFVLRGYVGKLKRARESAKVTLEQLADRTGLAVETISRLENGALTNPTWKTLVAYAAAIGARPAMDLLVENNGEIAAADRF